MNNILENFATSAIVPVVVLDDAKDAVATAKALLAGGVDVMEITFRTAAAADSIKAVAETRQCPAFPIPPAALMKRPAKIDFLPSAPPTR